MSRRGAFGPRLAAAATGVQVGVAMVLTRHVADEAGPATLAAPRYAVASAVLLPAAFLAAGGRPPRFRGGDLLPLAALGALRFGAVVALPNVGLRHLPAGRAALVFATFPLMAMGLAAALGQERLRPRRALGAVATVAGVGAALGEGALAGDGGAPGRRRSGRWPSWPPPGAGPRAPSSSGPTFGVTRRSR